MSYHNNEVLLACGDSIDRHGFQLTLNEVGMNKLTIVELNIEAIVKQLIHRNISILFLDVTDQDHDKAVSIIRDISGRVSCQIIAVGRIESIDLYRELLLAGAKEYLLYPVNAKALEHIDFSFSQTKEAQQGKVISVVGSKGGVGSSTLIANLSRLIAEQSKQVAVADLDFVGGDLDLHLSVQGNTALVEMLQYPERLEPVVYQRSGIEVNSYLTLFTGYLSLETDPFWPSSSALDQFKQFSLHNAEYLLIDIPCYSLRDQVAMSVLNSADIRIILVEPTLTSLRNTTQLLKQMRNEANKKNIIVLNNIKAESCSLITVADVSRALGRGVDVVIPYAPKHFMAKETLGKVAYKGNNKVSKAFQSLLGLIDGEPKVTGVARLWKRGA